MAQTLTTVVITQSGAGATDLVAAPGANSRIKVVSLVVTLSATGTVQFTEGTGPTALTGVMPLTAGVPLALSSGDIYGVVLSTNTANAKLSISTGTGLAFGWLTYYKSDF